VAPHDDLIRAAGSRQSDCNTRKGAGYDRIFKSTSFGVAAMSNRCSHLANEFTNFRVHDLLSVGRRYGNSLHFTILPCTWNKCNGYSWAAMTPCGLQLFCNYVALVSEAYDQNRNEHTQYIW